MLRGLAQELSRQGLEIVVATTDDDGEGRYPAGTHPVPAAGHVRYEVHPRTFRFYSFSISLGSWLRKHVSSFDLVHVHGLFSHAPSAASFWAARQGVPYLVRPLGVLGQWGLENRRRWLKRLSLSLVEAPLLARCFAIHCTSEAEAREVQLAGIAKRSIVVPNPVAIDLQELEGVRGNMRRSFPSLASRKWLLFLGRIDPKKGLEVTLAGLAQIPAPMRPLLLLAGAGEAKYEEELRRLQGELGLQEDVLWLGFLDGTQKLEALASSDAFLLSSYSENFGIAAAEAMASGVPVVVSDRVGLAPAVREHRAGLVIPPEPSAVAGAISRILTDQTVDWGGNGKRCAANRWSLSAVAVKLIEVYEQALESDPTAS